MSLHDSLKTWVKMTEGSGNSWRYRYFRGSPSTRDIVDPDNRLGLMEVVVQVGGARRAIAAKYCLQTGEIKVYTMETPSGTP